MSDVLTPSNTVAVANVRHRLALGVQWIDALTQLEASGDWVSELDSIGARPCPLRFDLHPHARHALRATGRLARLLTVAAADKQLVPPPSPELDPTNFMLHAYGRRSARLDSYATGNDPRQYVPRRLSLTPVQSDGVPATGIVNIRAAWLWPGSTYPLAAQVSALRGGLRRGPSEALAVPVAWARVVVTRPGGGPPDFDNEVQLGWGHGDDRGEFLVVLGSDAVPGGADLPATMPLRLWVFLPPADGFDPDDPLASLPLETSDSPVPDDILRGVQPPPGYLRQNPIDLTLAPGATATVDPAQLLFA